MRILLVEDDTNLAQFVQKGLREERYAIDWAGDGEVGLDLAGQNDYDLLIVDILLPKLDGLTLCRRYRAKGGRTPILLLTAQDSVQDKVAGLDSGADDYLTKPFAFAELLARVRALHRRAATAQEQPERIQVDGIRLDLGRCLAARDNGDVHLTNREVGILRWLYNHRTRAVSRAELLQEVWGVPGDLQTRTVDMHVQRLRTKLEEMGDMIETVRGFGYRFKAPERSPRKK